MNLLVILALGATAYAPIAPSEQPTLLVLDTEVGEIAIELAADAAPGGVARIVEVTRGPLYDRELFPEVRSHQAGYFDGLAFDFTRPRVEVLLEARRPSEVFRLPTEISAVALGLDADNLADAGAAMDAMQFEILPASRRLRAAGTVSERLAGWLVAWYETYRADVLVGVSRREVLEALGHRFVDGIPSRPVARGAVFLEPVSPTQSELRLGIALADLPRRTGTTMVVGRVARGLELLDEISTRPLLDAPAKDFRPLNPVRVKSARIHEPPDSGEKP